MFRLLCLFALFITIVDNIRGNVIIYGVERRNGEITIVTNDTRYQTLHPNLMIQKMLKSNGPKLQKQYEIGKRITGDKLLGEQKDQQSFPSPKDVQVLIRYPKEGEAETLTYVNVLVDQSSSIGEGYVVDGGIEKKYIELLVEANNTLHFSYIASFYGY